MSCIALLLFLLASLGIDEAAPIGIPGQPRTWSTPAFPIPAQDLAVGGMIQTESGPVYVYGFYPSSRYYYGPELPKLYLAYGVTPDQVYPIAPNVLGYYRDALPAARRAAEPPPLVPSAARTARLHLLLPHADAEVWINDYQTTSRGMTRVLETPELEEGKTYYYRVRGRWIAEGKTRTEERIVAVRAGQISTADFTRLPDAEKVPAPKP